MNGRCELCGAAFDLAEPENGGRCVGCRRTPAENIRAWSDERAASTVTVAEEYADFIQRGNTWKCPGCGSAANEHHADGCKKLAAWIKANNELMSGSLITLPPSPPPLAISPYSVTEDVSNGMGRVVRTVTFKTHEEMLAYIATLEN